MTANRVLAELRGLGPETIERIDHLHSLIYKLIEDNIGKEFSESVYAEIEGYEYVLQRCWGFPENHNRHTWKKVYQLKNEWVGRKFMCTDTGEEFTIPFDVRETDCFYFGNAFIDVGRAGCYSRQGGSIKEIV